MTRFQFCLFIYPTKLSVPQNNMRIFLLLFFLKLFCFCLFSKNRYSKRWIFCYNNTRLHVTFVAIVWKKSTEGKKKTWNNYRKYWKKVSKSIFLPRLCSKCRPIVKYHRLQSARNRTIAMSKSCFPFTRIFAEKLTARSGSRGRYYRLHTPHIIIRSSLSLREMCTLSCFTPNSNL